MGVSIKLELSQLGYRKPDAAKFVGFSASKFDQMVKDGRMPQPHRVDGMVIWRADELVRAFDALTGRGEDGDKDDDWDDY